MRTLKRLKHVNAWVPLELMAPSQGAVAIFEDPDGKQFEAPVQAYALFVKQSEGPGDAATWCASPMVLADGELWPANCCEGYITVIATKQGDTTALQLNKPKNR